MHFTLCITQFRIHILPTARTFLGSTIATLLSESLL